MSSADQPGENVRYLVDSDAAAEVRSLASGGLLAQRAAEAPPAEHHRLHRGGYTICWPIVYQCLTRGVEYARGHHRCAAGLEHLQPDCLDRFEDDCEAVVADLLKNATTPIRNLEGWVRSRLGRATIDAHRRRRGERGAVQRPRIPGWLAERLAGDRWLSALALHIQTWVAVPTTAGTRLWPYGAWVERRIAVTGDPDGTEQDVVTEVETVLAAMRVNRGWYQKYIERPLGRKQAPLLPTEHTADDPSYLPLAQQHEKEETLLSELAAVAINAMVARIARGEDPRSVVVDVIGTVFGSGTGADQMDRPPGAGSAGDEPVPMTLADGRSVDRIVRDILRILGVADA